MDHEMLDRLKDDYGVTELDPDLLSSGFTVQTKWHVIMGAPCCGKTTLIDLLAGKGFETVPESARPYLEGERAKGRTFEEIWRNKDDQRHMKGLQLRIEQGLSSSDTLFLDRALPDCLTFYRLVGLNPNEALAECLHHRYASIFIPDRLPIQQDGIRTDDDAIADLLDERFARDYGALGYDVVRVPVLPPEERLAFVLERLSEQGLI